MSLEDQVKQALVDAGNQLKASLWRPEDQALLTARAKDLVGLQAKAAAEQDPGKRQQYRLAAESVVDHVKLLALLRMQVLQNEVPDALGRFFMKVVIPALAALLKALF
jgi:hypothetical protein